MRKALNENPKVQIGLLGGLALIVGLIMLMRMGGSEAATPEPAAPVTGDSVSTGTTAPSATGTPTATGSPSGVAPSGTAATGAAPTVAPTPTTVSPEALVPGPGLPRPVIKAWRNGDAIVLLIARGGATDDRLVRSSVRALSEPGVSVFVARAGKVARYSRITQGVGVNRVPALVVVRPKRLSGGTPRATVSYGFRDSQSVVQAVRDALYSGKDNLPYNPG
jgi:hypothetical protein